MSTLGLSRVRFSHGSPVGEYLISTLKHIAEEPGFETDAFAAANCKEYETLAAKLDAQQSSELMRTACVVDLTFNALPVWSTIKDVHPMRPSWLVWRYPEIYWIFLIADDDAESLPLRSDTRNFHFVSSSEYAKLEYLLRRHANGLRAWFDPANLRGSAASNAALHPRRGIVFDEELAFAAFNGYLLYRHGISSSIVSTAAEFCESRSLGAAPGPIVILEDLELMFEDQTSELSPELLSPIGSDTYRTIQARLDFWGLTAAGASPRIFVSSSLVTGQPSVIKPFGGMYERAIRARLGPPVVLSIPTTSAATHSAAGAHQAIASKLVDRARRYECKGTVEAIQGALLALSAERLLDNRTYAMALESLTLRHGFEVRAECGFAGASGELEIAPRIAELRQSINQLVFRTSRVSEIISQLAPTANSAHESWRKLYKRSLQATNGLLEALAELRESFWYYKRLEEEECVLQNIRRVRVRSFLLKRTFSRRSMITDANSVNGLASRVAGFFANTLELMVRGVLSLPLVYLAAVLNPLVLALAVVGWIIGFGYGFSALSHQFPYLGAETPDEWIRRSAVTFLAFGDPHLPGIVVGSHAGNVGFSWFWNLSLIEMVLGYIHLALLVAVLVRRITRTQ